MSYRPRHRAPVRLVAGVTPAALVAGAITSVAMAQSAQAASAEPAGAGDAAGVTPSRFASAVSAPAFTAPRSHVSTVRIVPTTKAATPKPVIDPATVVEAPLDLLGPSPIDRKATRKARKAALATLEDYAKTRLAWQQATSAATASHLALAKARADLGGSAATAAKSAPSLAGLVSRGPAALAAGLSAAAAAPAVVQKAREADAAATTKADQAALAHSKAIVAAQRAVDKLAAQVTKDRARITKMAAEQARKDAEEAAAAQAALLASGYSMNAQSQQVASSILVKPMAGNVTDWINQALTILYASGYPQHPDDAANIALIIRFESGGKPGAINLWDSNAAKGQPSFGLMQTIPATFNRWALPGYTDKGDPIAQIMAGARYSLTRYGGLSNVPGVVSIRNGGGYRPY